MATARTCVLNIKSKPDIPDCHFISKTSSATRNCLPSLIVVQELDGIFLDWRRSLTFRDPRCPCQIAISNSVLVSQQRKGNICTSENLRRRANIDRSILRADIKRPRSIIFETDSLPNGYARPPRASNTTNSRRYSLNYWSIE